MTLQVHILLTFQVPSRTLCVSVFRFFAMHRERCFWVNSVIGRTLCSLFPKLIQIFASLLTFKVVSGITSSISTFPTPPFRTEQIILHQ